MTESKLHNDIRRPLSVPGSNGLLLCYQLQAEERFTHTADGLEPFDMNSAQVGHTPSHECHDREARLVFKSLFGGDNQQVTPGSVENSTHEPKSIVLVSG